jgi:ankyrin repeat protein
MSLLNRDMDSFVGIEARNFRSTAHRAVVRADTAQLAALLDNGELIDQRCPVEREGEAPGNWYFGHTLLSLAIVLGHIDVVELLLRRGVNVNASAHLSERVAKGLWSASELCEWHPCHLAARCSFWIVAKMLFSDKRVNLTESDSHCRTVLHHAAANPDHRFLKMLLKIGVDDPARRCDVNDKDRHGDTACHVAARNSNPQVLTMLIAAGADVNARNNRKMTPCHDAAANVNDAIVALLIDAKVDVNAADVLRQTPALIAAANDNDNVLAMLIDAGADIHATALDGQTACHFAARNTNDRVMRRLIGAGIDCRARDRKGHTPAREAATAGCLAPFRAIVAMGGVNLNDPDSRGMTLCHRAAGAARADVLQFLMRRGANWRARDIGGRMPLHCASEAAVEVLFAAGVNLNAKTHVGQTALHLACTRENSGSFVALLAAGANPNEADTMQQLVSSLTPAILQPYLNCVDLDEHSNFDGDAQVCAAILKRQHRLMKMRALEVCNALQSLSAMELCSIMANIFAPLESLVPFHRVWAIVTTVKHGAEHWKKEKNKK